MHHLPAHTNDAGNFGLVDLALLMQKRGKSFFVSRGQFAIIKKARAPRA